MPSKDQRYNVTIGMGIVKAECPGFSDFGLRYSNMDYTDMVQVEAAFAKHAEAIIQAMKPLIADLVLMGMETSAELNKTPKRNPGR